MLSNDVVIESNKYPLKVIEKALREEVFMLSPNHRKYFNNAIFDRSKNALYGDSRVLFFKDKNCSLIIFLKQNIQYNF